MLTESEATIRSASVLVQLLGLPPLQLAPSTTAVFDAIERSDWSKVQTLFAERSNFGPAIPEGEMVTDLYLPLAWPPRAG